MNLCPLIDASRPRRQRGAGALITVLVLFFVISMVAAYSSRNMIFEQKTSANQYRSTQAFEVAEAGLEWGLAMLNTGRVDDTCLGNTTGGTVRSRYLTIDQTTGAITPKNWLDTSGFVPQPRPFNPMCVRTGPPANPAWSCNCPSTGAPVLSPPAGTSAAPAFRLTFSAPTTRPGVLSVRSQGCTRLDSSCLNDNLSGGGGDGVAAIYALVALRNSVATPPGAALTAGGTVNVGAAAMTVVNTDPSSGITIDAGGAVNNGNIVFVAGAAGTPGAAVSNGSFPNDSTLPATPDLLFASIFGMSRSTYQQQPATIVLTCPADCGAVALSNLAAKNPGRILWLEGDVSLDTAVDIGSATAPVVVIAHGNLVATTTPVRIFGLLYTYNAAGTWTTAGSPQVQGATVAEGNVGGTGTPTIIYDQSILTRLRMNSGSFVRVPGGWKDFL